MNDEWEQWPPIEGDKSSGAGTIVILFTAVISTLSFIAYLFL